MNRRRVITIAGSILALIIGITVAYPLFISNFPSLSKPDLTVNVVYAYVQPLSASSELPGLYWNNSVVDVKYSGGLPGGTIEADGIVVSYLVVLNVTNNSTESARITNFETIIGPQISIGEGGSISGGNPILTDRRHYSYLSASDNELWSPQSSKLIGLSGVAGIHANSYAAFNDSAIYLYGSSEGQAAEGNPGTYSSSYDLKHVDFQNLGNGYLYNDLLNENQILLFYSGLTMSVATRR